jgi:hypothetical protein
MDSDETLRRELSELGMTEASFRALALLPLVEVAWADRQIQASERQVILEIAEGHDLLNPSSGQLLKSWLTVRPSPEYFARSRKLLVKLAHRSQGIGQDLPSDSLDSVLVFCSHVAEAAGGLFGLAFTVSQPEQAAMRKIAQAIEEESGKHRDPTAGIVGHTISVEWQHLLDELDGD